MPTWPVVQGLQAATGFHATFNSILTSVGSMSICSFCAGILIATLCTHMLPRKDHVEQQQVRCDRSSRLEICAELPVNAKQERLLKNVSMLLILSSALGLWAMILLQWRWTLWMCFLLHVLSEMLFAVLLSGDGSEAGSQVQKDRETFISISVCGVFQALVTSAAIGALAERVQVHGVDCEQSIVLLIHGGAVLGLTLDAWHLFTYERPQSTARIT